MSDLVRARVSAVKDLSHALTTYERGFSAAAQSARSDLNAAGADLDLVVVRSQTDFDRAARRVEALRSDLAACQEHCEPIERQLSAATVERDRLERRWQVNKQARERFARAASELLSSIGSVESATLQATPAGRRYIQEYAQILQQYLGRSA